MPAESERAYNFGRSCVNHGKKPNDCIHHNSANPEGTPMFVDMATPGQRKLLLPLELPQFRNYQPEAVASSWCDYWEKIKLYAEGSINITGFPHKAIGIDHIGISVNTCVMDAYARYYQLTGEKVKLSSGLSYAVLEAEDAIERRFNKGSKVQITDFVHETDLYCTMCLSQAKSHTRDLGVPIKLQQVETNLSEECFTKLYHRGRISRKPSMVNWSYLLCAPVPESDIKYTNIKGRTAIPVPGYDTEIEFGVINDIIYPIEGSNETLVISTTKPETMFADVAIAVHPDDERYKHLHGKYAIHPIHGRRIPIISDDDLVDMNFGTGAVRLAPSNNIKDYRIGLKYDLEFVQIFNPDGTLNSSCGVEWSGLKRLESRKLIIDSLKKKGLFVGSKDNPMRIQISSKTKDIIEKRLHSHWWFEPKENPSILEQIECIKVYPKALKASLVSTIEQFMRVPLLLTNEQCVLKKDVTPSYFVRLHDGHSESNFHDSRFWVVAKSYDEADKIALERFPGISFDLIRDQDNFSTWFHDVAFFERASASGSIDLLVASVSDMERIARAICVLFALRNEVCFKEIFFHPMALDFKGRKLSKSLGNVFDSTLILRGASRTEISRNIEKFTSLDPKESERLINELLKKFPKGFPNFGADVLRANLLRRTGMGVNWQLNSLSELENDKKILSRIYQLLKRVVTETQASSKKAIVLKESHDIWMYTKLQQLKNHVDECMASRDFSGLVDPILEFWTGCFDTVYFPLAKVRKSYASLDFFADASLKILHIICPFITEEFWQRLRGDINQSIALTTFTEMNLTPDPVITTEFEKLLKFSELLNSYISMIGNHSNTEVIVVPDRSMYNLFLLEQDALVTLNNKVIKNLSILGTFDDLENGHNYIKKVFDGYAVVYILVSGFINTGDVISKISSKLGKLQKKKETLLKVTNAKASSRASEETRQKSRIDLKNITENINLMEEIILLLKHAGLSEKE